MMPIKWTSASRSADEWEVLSSHLQQHQREISHITQPGTFLSSLVCRYMGNWSCSWISHYSATDVLVRVSSLCHPADLRPGMSVLPQTLSKGGQYRPQCKANLVWVNNKSSKACLPSVGAKKKTSVNLSRHLSDVEQMEENYVTLFSPSPSRVWPWWLKLSDRGAAII